MGNASKKPKRQPVEAVAPRAPHAPPRFAVVRTEPDEIKIVNVEHVTLARFTVLPSGAPLLYLETIADTLGACFEKRGGIYDPEQFTGAAAVNLAAHLILLGVDVEGAADALGRARGEMYASYFGPAIAEHQEHQEHQEHKPDDAPPLDHSNVRRECKICVHNDACETGWIPGGVDGECGAFEIIGGRARLEAALATAALDELHGTARPASVGELLRKDAERHTRAAARSAAARAAFDADDCAHVKGCDHWRRGLGCTVPNFDDCPKIKAASVEPSITIAALDVAQVGDRIAERAIESGIAGIVTSPADRSACSYGKACQRFPACDDCSLIAEPRPR